MGAVSGARSVPYNHAIDERCRTIDEPVATERAEIERLTEQVATLETAAPTTRTAAVSWQIVSTLLRRWLGADDARAVDHCRQILDGLTTLLRRNP